jgi:RNA polymerase sigma factor (sigma-70 family)
MDGEANLERLDRKGTPNAPQDSAESRPTSRTGFESEATSWRPAAAATLLTRYGPRLQRCAERCLAWRQRETDVEPADLVEAALIKLMGGTVGRRGSEEQLARSICAVICNLSRDIHKFERKFAPEDETDLLPDGRDPNGLIERALLEDDEEVALQALPAMMQACVMGCWFEGGTAIEVAADLGISESTVRNHLARARPRLRGYLRRYTPEGSIRRSG